MLAFPFLARTVKATLPATIVAGWTHLHEELENTQHTRKPGDWYFPMSVKHEHNTILPNCESISKTLVCRCPLLFWTADWKRKTMIKELGTLSLLCLFLQECVFKSYSRQPFSQLLTVVLLQQQDKWNLKQNRLIAALNGLRISSGISRWNHGGLLNVW